MICSLSLLFFCVRAVVADNAEGYRNEETAAEDNSNWMAGLDGRHPISRLSLPGTHDTGAYNFGRETTETQQMNAAEQLKAGIRAWDIRLGTNHLKLAEDCIGPDLWTFHGTSCQFEKFKDILKVAQTFLQAHGGETIIMAIQDETKTVGDFHTAVEAEMDSFPGLFYNDGGNPALEKVRGKIVLIQNYASATRGISWGGGSLNIQNNFNIANIHGLAVKWGNVKDHFIASNDMSTLDNNNIYVNFMSASGGGFPYFFASGKSSWETNAQALLTGWVTGPICDNDKLCIGEYYRVSCLFGLCSVAFIRESMIWQLNTFETISLSVSALYLLISLDQT
jgi:1-phosphatidylinositol phosphodiesterase